jgi:MFS family permease
LGRLVLVPIADAGMPMPVILGLLFAYEFGAGLGVMILDINVGAILSARIPDRIRSRSSGAFRFINYGVRPIGALLGGLLGAAIGVREALFVASIAATLGVLWLVGSRVLRLRDLPEPGEAPGG